MLLDFSAGGMAMKSTVAAIVLALTVTAAHADEPRPPTADELAGQLLDYGMWREEQDRNSFPIDPPGVGEPYDPMTGNLVRELGVVNPLPRTNRDDAKPPPAPSVPPPSPKRRDICERTGGRRVEYNKGRSWRCSYGKKTTRLRGRRGAAPASQSVPQPLEKEPAKMKHVDAEALVNAIPIQMTRREKLLRWAKLVRCHKEELALFHGIEYMRLHDLRGIIPAEGRTVSALTLAVVDPGFQSQGLNRGSNLVDVMKFFELSQGELHKFSCDCGGYIDNRTQAVRIEQLAG
jgi:hypothetical protein